MNNKDVHTESIEGELLQNGVCLIKPHGRSMKPLFREGRDAVILKTPDREIKKYDVVLYADALGRHILHRVIAVKRNTFVIRGDNTYKKEFVAKSDILAYMTSFNRNGKRRGADILGYKLYARTWHFLYPLRFLFHKFKMLIKRILMKKQRT